MNPAPRYRRLRVGGCLQVLVEQRPDGVQVLRSAERLGPFPPRLTDRLEHWAAVSPDRTLVARRSRGAGAAQHNGAWSRISFEQMLQRAQAVGQALVDRRLSSDRPVAILSDNDLEHMTLALGAMWAGVPWVPVSPAYSLLSQDHGKLRHILGVTTPGLVFASGPDYARAIGASVPPDTEVVLTEGRLEGREVTQ
ncbi:MAG TPA: AMP-binding protein, partial [Rubrivivax sp.]|nr:AMP-binding protein [Rubrivivax sp.]